MNFKNLHLNIFLLSMFLIAWSFAHSQQVWNVVGNINISNGGGASYTVITADAAGTPYVLLNDGNFGNKATVMNWDGAAWNFVGNPGFSDDGVTQRGDIAISPNGEPWVILQTTQNSPNGLEVWRFDGSNWVSMTPTSGIGTNFTIEPRIVFDGNTPYIGFSQLLNGSWGLSVMKLETGSWQYVGTPQLSASFSYFGALKIFNGTPYAAFADGSNSYYPKVQYFDGVNWIDVGNYIENYSVVPTWFDLEIASDGTPYVVYTNSNTNELSSKSYDGTNWNYVGQPNFDNAFWIDLEINSDDEPVIGYQSLTQSPNTQVQVFQSGFWATLGSYPPSYPELGDFYGFTENLVLTEENAYLVFADNSKATVVTLALTAEPECPEITVDVISYAPGCFGYDYQLTITPNGGTGPYTITAIGGSTSATEIGDGGPPPSGSYIFLFDGFTTQTNVVTISVIDGNGCETVMDYEVTNPEAVVAGTAVSTAASCANAFDGTITYSGQTGGTPYIDNPNYQDGWEYFLYLDGASEFEIIQGSPTFTGLAPGLYFIGAGDGNGCGTGLLGIEVMSPEITIDVSPGIACFGSNYQLTIVPNGGTEPYSITASSGTQDENEASILLFDGFTTQTNVVTISVIDGNGCETVMDYEVTNPEAVVAGTAVSTAASCAYTYDGTITYSGQSGGTPYVDNSNYPDGWQYFLYLDGASEFEIIQGSPTFTGLAPGLYFIGAGDGNGCGTGLLGIEVMSPEITIDVSPGIACFGSNYQLTIVPNGGTEPYSITASSGTQDENEASIFLFDGFTTQTNVVTISVIDGNGCETVMDYEVTNPEAVVAGTAVSTAASCANAFDGTITYSGQTGGTPYIDNPNYQDGWEYFLYLGGASEFEIIQGSPTFTGLAPGLYLIGAGDGNGCGTGLLGIEVMSPEITIDVSPGIACFGSNYQLTIVPNGGTEPYSITASSGTQDENEASILLFDGFTTQTNVVTISVIDGNGCETVMDYEVTNPEAVVAGTAVSTAASCAYTYDGTITYSGQSGGTPYVDNSNYPDGWQYFLYLDGAIEFEIIQGSPTFTGLAPGFYRVGAGEAGGCGTEQFSIEVIVEEDTPPTVECPMNILVDNDPNSCSAEVTFNFLVEDNCDVSDFISISGAIVTSPGTAVGVFESGTTEVFITAFFNNYADVYDCSFFVTVNDIIAPEIVCPDNVFVNADSGKCSVKMQIPLPQIIDNCDPSEYTLDIPGIDLDYGFTDIGAGNLDQPRVPTFGPDGNIYLTNYTFNQTTFAQEGNVLRYNGETGDFIDEFISFAAGGLVFPRGIEFGPDGNLYVASSNSDEVKKFDGVTGALISTLVPAGGQLRNPRGLTFGPGGDLFVGSRGTRQILRYNSVTGALISVFAEHPTDFIFIIGIEFGPNGNLFVVDFSGARVIEFDGTTGALIGDFAQATPGAGLEDVTFAPDGNAYATGFGSGLFKFDGTTGALLEQITVLPNTTFGVLEGITVGPCGNIFFTDLTTDRIIRLPIGGIEIPIGTYTATASITDPGGQSVSCSYEITVNDIGGLDVTEIMVPSDPVALGNPTAVSGSFVDECDQGHDAVWNWGDGSSSTGTVNQGSNTVSDSHVYAEPGVYIISLTVSDDYGNDTEVATTYAVVYDPSGGFVTGGGWINSPAGAYTPDPTLAGKANFGFVAKYKKGANVPDGNTTFHLNAADFKFKSTSYEWLVIAGAKAKYKGEGEVNGQGTYTFMLTGIDGQISGGGGTDKFRIKIWDRVSGGVVYDNKLGSDDEGYDTQELGGGSIQIHKGGNNNSSKNYSDNINASLIDGINVFPNPASLELNISVKGFDNTNGSTLNIFDNFGKLVYAQKLNENINHHLIKLSVDGFNSGIYYATLQSDEVILTKRFLVIK